MAENTQATPPHLPTYNVHMPRETAEAIVALVLPNSQVVSYEQLESGRSYNNRIYFIETKLKTTSIQSKSSSDTTRLVLKLSGHYFGASKVQNEIGSLFLLQERCPSIPVPKVIAWSEEGKTIRTAEGDRFDHDASLKHQMGATSKHGWVLMTRLPGRLVTRADLEGEYAGSLMREVAGHLAHWRKEIRNVSSIGNMRLHEETKSTKASSIIRLPTETNQSRSLSFTVGGLLLCHQYDPTPLHSSLSYYVYLANDQRFRLRQVPQLKLLDEKIGTEVQSFIDEMPHLSFLQAMEKQNRGIKLTHMDLSPRNLLISDSPGAAPRITGLLDFEFAAFLPFEEEFINMQVRQPDDWTSEQYGLLVTELARQGCEVPHIHGQFAAPICTRASGTPCPCDSRIYEGLCLLVRIIDNIAPWFIQGDSHTGPELEKQIETAANVVLSGIRKIRGFL